MRYGIISDIHANLPALEAVLEGLREVDRVVCLGDIVGYGADPNQCCDTVRDLGCPALKGNHDAGVTGELDFSWFNSIAAEALAWTRRALTARNLDFLERLPLQREQDGFLMVHGSPVDPWEYIYDAWGAERAFSAMQQGLCFFGHTHLATAFVADQDGHPVEQVALPEGGCLELRPDRRYLINPGGVGQPRDGNPKASYLIYDSETRLVEWFRVDYPIAEEQRRMREAGIHECLVERLGVGF